MRNRSPSGKSAGHGTGNANGLHKGLTNSAPSAVEPKPKGGSVDSSPTRSGVGQQAPTIGPRNA